MLEEADAIAAGEKEAANFDDIFGSEDSKLGYQV